MPGQDRGIFGNIRKLQIGDDGYDENEERFDVDVAPERPRKQRMVLGNVTQHIAALEREKARAIASYDVQLARLKDLETRMKGGDPPT